MGQTLSTKYREDVSWKSEKDSKETGHKLDLEKLGGGEGSSVTQWIETQTLGSNLTSDTS